VQQLQDLAAPQSGRLLRILFLWFREVPAHSAAAWLLRVANQESKGVVLSYNLKRVINIQGAQTLFNTLRPSFA
jgi:hypothetical protein